MKSLKLIKKFRKNKIAYCTVKELLMEFWLEECMKQENN